MKKGKRLDTYLSEAKLSESRERAKREIIAGWVKVNGETVRDPDRYIKGNENIRIERPGGQYVSRGGIKLQHALAHFKISIIGKTAADLGASTGGFTHCLLEHGAERVYAVDVGYGQLDYRMRSDPRVVVMERTHVRNLTKDYFEHRVEFITVDLSFISITKLFDIIRDVFSPVQGLILIKPQFEAKQSEHKKGVVKKINSHKDILKRVIKTLSEKGMIYKGLCHSPIKGPAGNIEFFLYFAVDSDNKNIECENLDIIIERVVEEAHENLDNNSLV